MQVVWFKRDLRLGDHRPLTEAVKQGGPVLLLYVMEPSIWQAGDLSKRHARFVYESLSELQQEVRKIGGELYTAVGEMEPILEFIYQAAGAFSLYAHEEHGTPHTFSRDRSVRKWMKTRQLGFYEYPPFGVTRGLGKRSDFPERWKNFMQQSILPVPGRLPPPSPNQLPGNVKASLSPLTRVEVPGELLRYGQEGGMSQADAALDSFLNSRFVHYQKHISKPLASSTSCSRLSPYLAWGNISLRSVYQQTLHRRSSASSYESSQLDQFLSRLHWHCHFIQRLEDEPRLALENMNRAFDSVRTAWDEELYQKWLTGTTGIPLIDASMRSLHRTGWINFRSRAMLVSFVCNTLLLDWKRPADDLAKLFLDYEPGIHFSQMQMQAGTTGFNTIRIYNPVKQGKDHDPEGRFIRRYVKELEHVSDTFIHEPWKDPAFFYSSYPGPVVDVLKANRRAREVLWSVKQSEEGEKQTEKQFAKHSVRRTENRKKRDKPAFKQLSLFEEDDFS
ncbi:FAD-binding domain-containing protein [Alkalicoccus halolimnae]|uniref:Deoxyribodipyrimidine photo-lyase n=1 Tax=Alkalicoccus halolimnae TaxID=1667239 RepID=A0AAJ8N0L9_9BACI|nr:deoxyribodipyrimidine photo-lyase [Alkalicoccus halolimnae]